MTPRLRHLAAWLMPALVIAACTASPSAPASSAAPSAPSGPPAAPSAPMPTASPSAPVPTASPAAPATPASPTEAPSESAGAVGSNPGITPIPVAPGGPGPSIGPIPVQPPVTVAPVANLLSVHDIRAESVKANVTSGGHLVATVTWWSGPSPCNDLSEVRVERTGNAFTLTVREGTEQLGIACPALAMHKQAVVDLGVLPAGNYTVATTGVDTPVTVTVSG